MAEEKASPPVEKKAVAEKKAAKAPAPDTEKKAVQEKKPAEAKVAPVKKKPAAEPEAPVAEVKTVTEEKPAEVKAAPVEKPATEAKAEPKVAKAAEKPAAAPVKKEKEPEKVAETVPEEKPAPKVVKTPRKEWAGNPMLKPVIEKVTVNMSVGQSGRPLEQAEKILKSLTNQKPSKRKAKKTVREFGIRKGENISCVVTLRDENAQEFLRKAFIAVENKLSKYNFDRQGNFSFGIKEHINIPGTKYSPELGIHGMDVSVSLGRPGYRVKRKHRAKAKIGKEHLLTSKEAILFIKDEFDVEIT